MAWGRTADAAEAETARARRGVDPAAGTVVAVVSATFVLVVLFFWTAVGGREEEEGNGLKLELDLPLLAIACGTLLVPWKRGWNPDDGGAHDAFHVGSLAASTFVVGNMFFVSFWYFVDLGNGDGDGGGGEGPSPQKVASAASILLALAFFALSFWNYQEGRVLPGRYSGGDDDETHVEARSAHLEMFGQLWTILSSATVVLFSIILIVACVASVIGEDAERRREEGGIVNLIVVLAWMVGLGVGATILGGKVLGERELGVLGVGMLSGGARHFALLLFIVSVLYSTVTSGEGQPEGEGVGPNAATSFACFFLSLLYFTFSHGMLRYKRSFIGALSENVGGGGGFGKYLFWK
mmetsp:Transcript_28652/g.60756  ORF Transcript_28652/g.60756 Transcript_28652/m.60756 type:complete len:352 (-) Transcript_28652:227-1282(-)